MTAVLDSRIPHLLLMARPTEGGVRPLPTLRADVTMGIHAEQRIHDTHLKLIAPGCVPARDRAGG